MLARWNCLIPLWIALAACSSTPAPPTDAGAPDRPARFTAPSCAAPSEAPLLGPSGATACAPVGATAASNTDPWPDTAAAAGPVVYVRAGSVGGSGTREAPFADVATALASTPTPATVALARGEHPLGATVSPTATVTLLGAGAGASILVAPPALPAVSLRATTTAVTVTVVGLTVRSAPGSADANTASLLSAGSAATLRLRDVAVEQPGHGVVVDQSATLCAERVTVSGARGFGVQVSGGARGQMRAVVVRDGASTGVLVGRARLALRGSLVANNAHDGVAFVGVSRGASCTTDADCAPAPACEGFLEGSTDVEACAAGLDLAAPNRTCVGIDIIEDTALVGNGVTGLRAQRARPTAAETAAAMASEVLAQPGPVVRARRIVVAGTTAPAGALPGGDGIYTGPGATLSLDADAALASGERGTTSQLLANARTGLLADGDVSGDATVPDRFRATATVSVDGARVGSNRGPGVFVQNRARAPRIAHLAVADNVALGLASTTGGAVALLLDNQFIDTRTSALTFEGLSRPLVLGDGASLVSTAGVESQLLDNQFIGNDRVGLLVAGGVVRLTGGNVGSSNGFGVAVLGGATLMGESASIAGVAARAPETLAYAQNSLSGAP